MVEFCRTAKLRRVATKLVGKCKGYSPWRCAINVASVKTTFSAAAPPSLLPSRRRRYCPINTFAKDYLSYYSVSAVLAISCHYDVLLLRLIATTTRKIKLENRQTITKFDFKLVNKLVIIEYLHVK